MLRIVMGGIKALEIIPEIPLHKLLCDLHSGLWSYFLFFKGYDKVVALPLVCFSVLPLGRKHLLQGSVRVAVVASHQQAALRLFFDCDVGNGVCKVHSHVAFPCLVDAG